MHSLEAELRQAQGAGLLDEDVALRAIALERGTVFSVHEELRAALYGGVALMIGGLGILIQKNLQRIGPITLMALLALVAAACYASAIRARLRGHKRSIAGDYVLLLGALLVSIDLGYAESQFHWLGANWSRHFVILAALHGITAYYFDSRLVLSASLASLASWFGVESRIWADFPWEATAMQSGVRAMTCALLVFAWRAVDSRLRPADRGFAPVFDHFATNLAFWGALAWCSDEPFQLPGAILLIALAVACVRKSIRSVEEVFAIYGVGYGALGLRIVLGRLTWNPLARASVQLLLLIGAAGLLWSLHERLRRASAERSLELQSDTRESAGSGGIARIDPSSREGA